MPKLRVKLIVPHKDGCISLRSNPENPWAYFGSGSSNYRSGLPEALYLDAIGRKPRPGAGGERWITVGCNCDCQAVLAVRERDITAAAQAALNSSATLVERYECAKRVHGDKLPERMAPYIEILERVAAGKPLEALAEVLLKNGNQISAGDDLLLSAAAVHLVERAKAGGVA